MRYLDQAFRELVTTPHVGRDAVDQLTHAASTLASMPATVATAITCTRKVPREQVPAFAALAQALAAKHRLSVRIELGDPVRIRFTRSGDA